MRSVTYRGTYFDLRTKTTITKDVTFECPCEREECTDKHDCVYCEDECQLDGDLGSDEAHAANPFTIDEDEESITVGQPDDDPSEWDGDDDNVAVLITGWEVVG